MTNICLVLCVADVENICYLRCKQSKTGMPVLKTEIFYPELKGNVGQDSFVASKLKIEIEIEPRKPSSPQQDPFRYPARESAWRPRSEAPPNTQQGRDWWDALKDVPVGVLVVATVVTVAYGASVVLSGGGSSLAAPGYTSVMGVLLASGTAATISVRTSKDQTIY